MNEIRDNTDQRLPANAPAGSIPAADVSGTGVGQLSQNRSPADPSKPQIPIDDSGPLADAAHPLGVNDGRGAKRTYENERADLQRKVEAMHQQAVAMFHDLGPTAGALAGDLKAAVLGFERRLASALEYHFGHGPITAPSPRADAARS